MDLIRQFIKISRSRDIKSAIEFQKALADRVKCIPLKGNIKSICAFDISYEKLSQTNYASAVIMTYSDLEIVDQRFIIENALFPYIPGLLSFREGPAIIRLYERLKQKPDILLFDGQGLAHPRGMGIASMMGLLLKRSSIGCAKSRLIGEYTEPKTGKGSLSELIYDGKIIGRVLRTREKVKPVFVSIGHLIELNQASEIVLKCCRRYRLPEPIRAAHNLANAVRRDKFESL